MLAARRRGVARAVRALLVWVMAFGIWARPCLVRADDLQAFELAKSRYDVGSYEEAAEQFHKLLDPDDPDYLTDAKLRQLAQPYYVATLIALGREKEADGLIATILREDPSYVPTPGLFPQQVTDRFIAMRAELRDELEALAREKMEKERQQQIALQKARAAQAKRIAELERLASQERVVEERSRWVAMIPFGVGQFQNGNSGLGWFFAISEALTAAGTIVSATVAYDFAAVDCRTYVDPDTGVPADCAELESSFLAARTVNWISFGSLAALVLAGIIEAQVSFDPEVSSTRPRKLPPDVRLKPAADVNETGAVLGVTVEF